MIRLGGRTLLNFSSNDYLGLAADPAASRRPSPRRSRRWGVGSGASRLVVGDTDAHRRLEARLARFEGTEAALLFNGGYPANLGIVQALVGRGDLVVSDALNHASLVDGCRLSRAEVVVVPHARPDAVAEALAAHPARRKLVVTDAVFSMDGDRAPLPALAEVCRQAGAALVVDEAHATGVLGDRGAGLCELTGVVPDVRMGTLGKALGVFGAYAAGSRRVMDLLLNRARSVVFSTTLASGALRGGGGGGGSARARSRAATAPVPQRAALRGRRPGAGVPPPSRAAPSSRWCSGVRSAHWPPRPSSASGTSWPRPFVRPPFPRGPAGFASPSPPPTPRRRWTAPSRRSRRLGPMDSSSRHERLLQADRAHVWHPFTQMAVWPSDAPLIIERAEGNELIDDLGHRYLDGVSSLWCNVHGHRKRRSIRRSASSSTGWPIPRCSVSPRCPRSSWPRRWCGWRHRG